jgi:F-type H+-transporting ATPase subunit gamma
MANLKELRSRITSVSSTMQITSAMKMVSAAKLSKAQDAITAMRPYSEKLTELLQSLSATMEGDAGSKYSEKREVKKVLIVAISSNRGLAGAFNTNIVKGVRELASTTYAGKDVELLTLGKKANDVLKKTFNISKTNSAIYENLDYEHVAEIAEELMQLFLREI